MKKYSFTLLALMFFSICFAQEEEMSDRDKRRAKKEAKRERVNEMIRLAEEGTLVYRKHNVFGIQAKTNGYGIYYEMGLMKTPRKTTTFRIDISETKDPKEEKLSRLNNNGFFQYFGTPFIYGKQNYFYPITLGVGQQYLLGQKGNKNGVAASLNYNAGVSIGLLRPYYLKLDDGSSIKFTPADSSAFLDGTNVAGGAGLGKGWKDLKVKPGAFAKVGLRFDYGRFNEAVQALEIGVNAEYYTSEIPIMLLQDKHRQLFLNAYISILFGRRK